MSSQPAAGWPLAAGSVGLPLEGIEVRVLTDRWLARIPRRGRLGTASRPQLVPGVLAKAGGDPRGLRFRLVRYRRPGLARRRLGFLTLVGRKNDLIITNGFNVYPQVVERVINECPGVRESAVVGVPDKKRGERVMAAVVRNDESARSRRRCGPFLANGWLITSGQPRSFSSRLCRVIPWARSCGASCVISFPQLLS